MNVNVKRVLITGGVGFLGSHLCERLLSQGHEVIALDNLSTGIRANVDDLLGHPSFRLIEQDVCTPLLIHVDEIYNFACPASPMRYQLEPTGTLKTSVLGAINVLDLASSTGAKVLQASTSEVYGDPQVHPQSEAYCGNVNPVGPRACYDEGKRCAETLFFDYHRQYGTRIKVVRIFNTYGPRMLRDDGRVVSNFVVQALRGHDITVYGEGAQTRSFCYVGDLIDALILAMKLPDDMTGPINIGNPSEISIKSLADRVIELTGSRSRLIYSDLPVDDPVRRCPDITLARTSMGWEPKVDLDSGLSRTIDYFEKILSGVAAA
ncbi:UDP-glucuronic acid decarboxylase family protein [Burkholderia sp. GS2Y]|uniref:UDP-glucuronic acid decarboxylase family protein n=1 Tax=Burkholderia theae TaxID=3143496 RepID=A0ABU9WDF7_9BURK